MSVKTHVYIDGSWIFHNKKHLIDAYGQDDYDIDFNKISLVIQQHLLNNLTIDVDIVRTYFFGTMPLNKVGFDSNKQKAFYKYLKEECHFVTDFFEIDYQNDESFQPNINSLQIALTSSVLYNAGLNTSYDIAAIALADPSYQSMIKRARMLGKRILLIGIKDSFDNRLRSRTTLFDYPVLYLDDYLDTLKLNREDHLRKCMGCDNEEMTNWYGTDFYCSECRENDSRAKSRKCNNCGKEEETTWAEPYYYCFDCRESYRKNQNSFNI
mgnify:CR=1 FL=1|tara:strand:+ start:2486 stop:3289 length:804 start_codon:yes stop_codon:yes gene_type:complete